MRPKRAGCQSSSLPIARREGWRPNCLMPLALSDPSRRRSRRGKRRTDENGTGSHGSRSRRGKHNRCRPHDEVALCHNCARTAPRRAWCPRLRR
eukprot:5666920-Prymnesium_polylepis.1